MYPRTLRTHFPMIATGALSAPGQAIVTSISTSDQQGTLSPEDGQAIYKSAKATSGGQKQNWTEIGIGLGVGAIVGYLLGRAF